MLTTNPKMLSLWWSSQIKIISNISLCLTFLLLQKKNLFSYPLLSLGRTICNFLAYFVVFIFLLIYFIHWIQMLRNSSLFFYGALQYKISKHQQLLIQVMSPEIRFAWSGCWYWKKKITFVLHLILTPFSYCLCLSS